MSETEKSPIDLSAEQKEDLLRLINDADEISAVVEKDRRWKWAGNVIKNTAAWIVALTAGWYAARNFLGDLIKGFAP